MTRKRKVRALLLMAAIAVTGTTATLADAEPKPKPVTRPLPPEAHQQREEIRTGKRGVAEVDPATGDLKRNPDGSVQLTFGPGEPPPVTPSGHVPDVPVASDRTPPPKAPPVRPLGGGR